MRYRVAVLLAISAGVIQQLVVRWLDYDAGTWGWASMIWKITSLAVAPIPSVLTMRPPNYERALLLGVWFEVIAVSTIAVIYGATSPAGVFNAFAYVMIYGMVQFGILTIPALGIIMYLQHFFRKSGVTASKHF